jgi:hypothetical protein
MVNNVNIGPVVTLSGASISGNTAAQDNPQWRGLHLGVHVTAITGTSPTITVVVEGLDEASGQYYALLSSAALSAAGFTLLTVYPGVAAAANSAASQVLPKSWRVSYTIAGTTPAVTATIGASLIV